MKQKLLLVLTAFILFTSLSASNSLLLKSGNYKIDDYNHSNTIESPKKSEVVSGYFYRLISFDEIPTQSEKEMLQDAGLEFLNYLPRNTYLVAIPTNYAAISSQLNQFNIEAIFKMPASFKIDDRIYDPSNVGYAYVNANEVKINIQYHKNIDPATARELLLKQDLIVTDRIDAVNVLIAQTKLSNVEELAKLDYINFVEPISDPGQHDDEQASSLHRSNVLNAAYSAGRKYDGTGLHAVINDDGAVGPHIDYTGRLTNYSGAGGGTHGDGTAGCLGAVGNLDPTKSAGATGVQIYVWDYTQNMSNTMTSYNNDSCRIISTSYSNGCNAGYTAVTQLVDMEISNNTDLLQVFSAGNSNNNDCGYGAGDQWGNITGGHKIAKNCIATANLFYDDGLVPSSSRGPAADGRIKPDLAAHGQNQQATAPNNAYMNFGGTSAAAPSLAGIATQLYDAYWDLNGGLPESGLIKAVMMNSADDLGNVGPDFIYGWGRINGGKAVQILENNQYLDATITQGNNNTHNITVPASVAEVRFMLYWMDPEAAIGSAPSLVNDLNLTVTDPSSNNLLPLVLDETPNATTLALPAVPGVDDLNNVEQVRVTSPATGTYTINVDGFAVPMGPQKYYVVYEFIYDDITVIYPQGGEGLNPGETEAVRWDAYGSTGSFDIAYSDDNGATWNTVTTGIAGNLRTYDWTVPTALTGEALVRITNGSVVGTSIENFSIIGVPVNLSVGAACPSAVVLNWDPVAGATGYDVYVLGNKYMDYKASSLTNTATISGVNPLVANWYSVRATGPTNAEGRRAIAINDIGQLMTASYVADFAEPCVGSTVTFQGGTVGGVNSWIWSFMPNTVSYVGGSTNTSQNPQVVLNGAGPYTVTLVSSNGSCSDTLTINNYLTPSTSLSLPQTEDFESTPLCGTASNCATEVCVLNSIWRNETNGLIDDIDWRTNEDDTPTRNSGGTPNSVQTGPRVDHNPGVAGGNYIYLEASGGCNNVEAQLVSSCIDLTTAVLPELSFWYHMLGSAIGNLSVDIFDGNAWNIGVASVSGPQGANWLEQKVDLTPYIGSTINIRINGSTGNSAQAYEGDMALDDIKIIDLVTQPPAVSASFSPNTVCVNQQVTFTGSVVGAGITAHNWNFGANATPATATTAGPHTVVYSTTGPKTVNYTVTNGVGSTPFNLTSINVMDKPVASFTDTTVGLTIDFTNTSTGGTTYDWDFGDGNTSQVANPSHTYATDGWYVVTLIVSNACGPDTLTFNKSVGTVGLNDVATFNINLYPNPNSGEFTVTLPNNVRGNVLFDVFDIAGKVVYSQRSAVNQNNIQFRLNNLSAGSYILKGAINDQITYQKLLIE